MANNEWQYSLPPRGTRLHAPQHGPTGRDPLSASMLPLHAPQHGPTGRDPLSASMLPLHDILSLHSYTDGAALDVFGLSAASTPARLTPSSNPGVAAALLCSTAAGGLTLQNLSLVSSYLKMRQIYTGSIAAAGTATILSLAVYGSTSGILIITGSGDRSSALIAAVTLFRHTSTGYGSLTQIATVGEKGWGATTGKPAVAIINNASTGVAVQLTNNHDVNAYFEAFLLGY